MENKRALWTEESLRNALTEIKKGLSQRKACEKYGIPRRTLRNHIKSGSTSRRLGRRPILTPGAESDLVNRILKYGNIGIPLTPKIVKYQVFRYVKKSNLANPFEGMKTAGRTWLKLFMKRHPELSLRKPQPMNPSRAQKLNKFIVSDYFDKLDSILQDMDLKDKPHRIFNMDEKGCRLTIHSSPKVLAQKGSKRVHLVTPEHGENVTIVGCVNALGNAISAMILFKGKRLKQDYLDNLPAGTLVKMSPKGFMNTELFVTFIEHLTQYKPPGLLILDGVQSHLDYTIVDVAEANEITLLCLPSNCTHELQPLDKSVYRSFEYHWNSEVLSYWDINPDRVITKSRFNILFSKVWPMCASPQNIVNGFRATGIFQFNRDAIPEEAFAPSILSHRNLPAAADSFNESDNSEDIPLTRLAKRLKNVKEPTSRVQNNGKSNTDTLNASFHDLLPTPESKTPKQTHRKKAINYRAQKITKDLFRQDEQQQSCSKRSDVARHNKDWYCFLCDTSEIADMRRCTSCSLWVHETCIGYTEDDEDEFVCPKC